MSNYLLHKYFKCLDFTVMCVGVNNFCKSLKKETIPCIENNDIVSFTLNFDNDIITVACEGKFETKGLNTIKGKKWLPFVQLRYPNTSATILD